MNQPNKEIINEARNYLKESKHNKCFGKIDVFFEGLSLPRKHPLREIQNEFNLLQTRFNGLHQRQQKGTITEDDFDSMFTKISRALYYFLDAMQYENSLLQSEEMTKESERVIEIGTLNLVLTLSDDYDDTANEKVKRAIEELNKILQLKSDEINILNIEKGSIKINVAIKRSYLLVCQLMSLVKIKAIDNLVEVKVTNDIVLHRFCESIVNVYLKLSDINFMKSDLRRVDLVGLDLRGADIRNVDLRSVDLRGTDLGGSDLRGVDLRDAKLRGSDIIGATLIDANLIEAYLIGVNLIGANLKGADLRGLDLRGLDLKESYLVGANLRRADLRDAVLVGVDLSRTDLSRTDLIGADLREAKLNNTIFDIDMRPILLNMDLDISTCKFIDSDTVLDEVLV